MRKKGRRLSPAAFVSPLEYPPYLAVLSEVLDGADHLRGVGVLVVVPRHDLDLVGSILATMVWVASNREP